MSKDKDFKAFKISYWPRISSTSEKQRTDISINNFENDFKLFSDIKTIKDKTNQKTMTRIRKRSRNKGEDKTKGGYRVGLDFDNTDATPKDIHQKLKDLEINHILYTTYGNKTKEGKYNGSYRFKVLLYTFVPKKELKTLTQALCGLVNKELKPDDMSEAIFFGGVHPNTLENPQCLQYTQGKTPDQTKQFLLDSYKEEISKVTNTNDDIDDDLVFEIYDKTAGQRFNEKDIDDALNIITGEAVSGYNQHDIWIKVLFALRSTQREDIFSKFDDWCQKCYEDVGTYNHDENLRIWEAPDDNRRPENRVSLGTLFHLKNIYLEEAKRKDIVKSEFMRLGNYLDKIIEPPSFLVNELIAEKSIGIIAGPSGIGKSSICIGLAKAVSSGDCLLNHENYQTQKGTVVLINKEDSPNKIASIIQKDFKLEKQKLLLTKSEFGDDESIISKEEITKIKSKYDNIVIPPWANDSLLRLSDEKGILNDNLNSVIKSLKKLEKELKDQNKPPIKLITFDPLNMWHGGDQNSQKDMSIIYSAFQQIQKELDTTIILIHHMNKSSGFSGSHVIRDSCRSMFYLRPAKVHPSIDSEKYLEFYVEKHNDARSDYKAFYLKKLNGDLFEFVYQKEIQDEVKVIEEENMYESARKALKLSKIKSELAKSDKEGV